MGSTHRIDGEATLTLQLLQTCYEIMVFLTSVFGNTRSGTDPVVTNYFCSAIAITICKTYYAIEFVLWCITVGLLFRYCGYIYIIP